MNTITSMLRTLHIDRKYDKRIESPKRYFHFKKDEDHSVKKTFIQLSLNKDIILVYAEDKSKIMCVKVLSKSMPSANVKA